MNSASVSFENEISEQGSSDSENDDESDEETDVEGDGTEVEDGDETEVEDGDETDGEEEDVMEMGDDGDENEVIDDEVNDNLSSDGESEVCAVCLNKFMGQELGSPESCNHTFCLQCLVEWSKNTNTCPIDRTEFSVIFAKFESSGSVTKKIKVKVNPREPEDALPEDTTACEVCRSGDREHRLLLCDACDLAYHCECLDPPLFRIPTNEWFCPPCATILNKKPKKSSAAGRQRVIPRTIVSETVRLRIQRLREGSDESPCLTPPPRPRAPVQRKQNAAKTGKRKFVRRRRRRRLPQKTVVLARTKQSVLNNGKTRVRVNVNTQVKYRRRRRRRKYKKRKTTTKRTVRTKRSLLASKPLAAPSAQQRIADRLGLRKPPSGHQIPYVKKPGTSSAKSSRAEYLPTLALFGNKDQLMDFGEDFSGEINKEIKASVVKSKPGPSRCCTAANFDLLGDILAEQKILHHDTKDVTICKDGSLKLKEKTVNVKYKVNVASVKKEQLNSPTVKKEIGVSCEGNALALSNKSTPLLIKQESLQSKNVKVSCIKVNGDAKISRQKVQCANGELKIRSKVSPENKVFNNRIKTEVRNDFLDRDSVYEPPVGKRRGERHDSSLKTRRPSELQAGIPWRTISEDFQLNKEKGNAMIKKEIGYNSSPLQLLESTVKTERTISRPRPDYDEHLPSYSHKIISGNTQEKLPIKSNHIDCRKSINMDPFKDMIVKVSKKIDDEMNKNMLEGQIDTLQMKISSNKQQTKDNIHHVDKVPPAYRKCLELEKAGTSKHFNYDSTISNRNSSVEPNTSNVKKKRVSLDSDSCSKRTIRHKSTDTFINKSLTLSREREDQLIDNSNIRIRSLSDQNERADTLENQSMFQEVENVISRVKMEALAPSDSEDMFVNQSQNASQESVNSYSNNERVKIEILSSNFGNVYANPLSSPSQESVNSYRNVKVKIEPFSLSDHDINPLQSPSQESVNSEISNVKVKNEPRSSSNYEDDVNPLRSPFWESVNSENSNVKVKNEPLSSLNYKYDVNLLPSSFLGSVNSASSNLKVKNEPLSPSNYKDDVNPLQSPSQESVNSESNNVKVKNEPLSSSNYEDDVNPLRSPFWESVNSESSNVKVKNEPLSSSNYEDDVNPLPSPFWESVNSESSNVKVKNEPLSSLNYEDDVNLLPSSFLGSVNSESSNLKVKNEPLSPSNYKDDVNPLQSPSQESVNSESNNVKVKNEPLSSSNYEDDVNPFWESINSESSNVKVKNEPLSSLNYEDVNLLPSSFLGSVNSESSNLKVKIEPLSSSNYENVSVTPNLSKENENFSVSNVKVEMETSHLNHDADVHVNQRSSLLQENTNSNIRNINVKVEPLSSTINKDDVHVNLLLPSLQESVNSYNSNANIKVEPLSQTINEGESVNRSSSPSQESTKPFISNPKIKVETFSPLVNDDDVFINTSGIQQTFDQGVDAMVETVIKLEKSPFDDFENHNRRPDSTIIPKKNIKTEIFDEQSDCIILYEAQKLKLERDAHLSLNEFLDEEPLIVKEYNKSTSIKTPNLCEAETPPLTAINETGYRKRKPPQDSDEVLIIFEKQVSMRKKIKIKKEKDYSETSSHLHRNMDACLENLSPYQEEKHAYLAKVKAERHSSVSSPRSEYSTHLSFSTETVKSEIVSPLADFTNAEYPNHSKNVRQSIDNFPNGNNVDDCHSNTIAPKTKIKTEPGEKRKLSNFGGDLHNSKHETVSESVSGTFDNLSGVAGNLFSQEIENCYVHNLQTSHSDKLNQRKRKSLDSERENGEVEQISHSGELTKIKLKRKISESETILKRSKQSNNFDSGITDNGIQDAEDSFMDLKIEGISNRANDVEITMDIGNSSLNHHNSSENNSQSNCWNRDNVTSVVSASSIFQPIFRIKEENYSHHTSCENNLHIKLENCSASPIQEEGKLFVDHVKIKVEKSSPVTSPNCDFSFNSSSNLDTVKSEHALLLNGVVKSEQSPSLNGVAKSEQSLSLNGVMKSEHALSLNGFMKSEKLDISDSINLNCEEHSHVNGMSSMTVKTERRQMDQKPTLESKNGKLISRSKKPNTCEKDLKIVNSPREHKHRKNGAQSENYSRIILLKQNFNTSTTSEVKQPNHEKSKVKEEDEDLKQKIEKEVKRVLYPFYKNGTISKKMHYDILHKSVPKVLLNCNNVFRPDKIKKLVCAYVTKMTKPSDGK